MKYLKESKVKNLKKIYINNRSGEAIQHELNGAIITGFEAVNNENIFENGQVVDKLQVINSIKVVINNSTSQKAKRIDEMDTVSLSGANVNNDIIIDVKRKGVTNERLYLASRIKTLTEEDIKHERERMERVDDAVNKSVKQYPVAQEHAYLPSGGDHFFGIDMNTIEQEDRAVIDEAKTYPGPVSILDKKITSRKEAEVFIQEALGVFDDHDVEVLLPEILNETVVNAASAVAMYVRNNTMSMSAMMAVNNYKKELRDMLGINEPAEASYER